MRDVNRLDNFYNTLKEFHKNIPDWRFGQFIMNFISWYASNYHMDLFYMEEDEILFYIKEFLKEMK